MRDLQKIPATVITGFLGAGKTTLIRHLLENAEGRRIALIINEFGDIGMDKAVLDATDGDCGIPSCQEGDVVELANGCICCTVADEFLPTMTALLERPDPPEHIVIETSGLALPKPLLKAFHWPDVRSRVTVDGVVAVIDTPAVEAGLFAEDPAAVQAQRAADPNFQHEDMDHENPLEEVFTDQLLCADMVLLNKSDLISEQGLAAIKADLKARSRAGVQFVESVKGQVPPRVLLGLNAGAEDDLEARPSHHDDHDDHDHDDFTSFAVDIGPVNDPDALEDRLLEIIGRFGILRLKGYLDIPGKPMRQMVQAVGPRLERYFDRRWQTDEPRLSRLVVIGLHGLDEAGIRRALQAATNLKAAE